MLIYVFIPALVEVQLGVGVQGPGPELGEEHIRVLARVQALERVQGQALERVQVSELEWGPELGLELEVMEVLVLGLELE